ncbi:MAG: Tll0287-like domain-containing protein [Nitrospiraceae bacterium]
MIYARFTFKALVVTVGLIALVSSAARAKDAEVQISIPVETVADYIHAVIQAGRTFYSMQVVERLQTQGERVVSEDWRIAHTLPLSAQLLNASGELGALTGTKVRYQLIGLWPINPGNGAQTDFERKGLEHVRAHPEERYSEVVTSGKERNFQAIYADRAVTQSCIGCHNSHPRSPKKDFKLNDVMGGILISIPVDR